VPVRFYTLVTADTQDQDYAARRQRFLAEQGYSYEIEDWGQPHPRVEDAGSSEGLGGVTLAEERGKGL